jgi:branched-chain amino acid transport system substrate-binding protein
MREHLLKELGLELVVDETFTPPLADATPLVQQLRTTQPDLFFFLPTVISDSKLILEKMNEFGLGQGRIPTISFGIAIAEPDMLNTMGPELLEGVMAVVANWGSKGHEDMIARLEDRYGEPWMTQNAISTYGDMWILKAALENAGSADREAVAEALRNLDEGPSPYFPGGELKFNEQGRREGAGLTIIQWQDGITAHTNVIGNECVHGMCSSTSAEPGRAGSTLARSMPAMMKLDQPMSTSWQPATKVHIGAFGSMALAAIAAA